MTKEQYIQIRLSDERRLIYPFYQERFDREKHKPFLDENSLLHLLMTFTDFNQVLSDVVRQYAIRFETTEVYDVSGRLIKIL